MHNHQRTVEAIYAAFGRGDVKEILVALADDVAWEAWENNHAQAAGVPWLLPKRGRAKVGEFFDYVGKWKINGFRVLSLMAGGNQVAAEIEIDAHVTQTGASYRDQEIHLWTFDESGKVSRFRHYVDTAKQIAASQPVR